MEAATDDGFAIRPERQAVQDQRLKMRRALDSLVWLLAIVAVSGVYSLATTPDVEASLGIPACVNLPHNGPCRLCAPAGQAKLPPVIDADNVRLIASDTGNRGL